MESMDDEMESEGQPGDSNCGPTSFCTNCTGRMAAWEELCEDCGHCPSNDNTLFDMSLIQPSVSESDKPKIALLYDERMELHAEGGGTPHPERPDRIRAVVARILSTGLGGEMAYLYTCFSDFDSMFFLRCYLWPIVSSDD